MIWRNIQNRLGLICTIRCAVDDLLVVTVCKSVNIVDVFSDLRDSYRTYLDRITNIVGGNEYRSQKTRNRCKLIVTTNAMPITSTPN